VAFELPQLSPDEFSRSVQNASPEPLAESILWSLYQHYQELRRWNRRLALLGPGTSAEVIERHYGESLAALPLIPREPGEAIDLGSGAGFPGFPLAAARPGLRMTLFEAREKKCAFLLAAARHSSLPVSCRGVRVSAPLPAGFPVSLSLVTVRALKLSSDLLQELGSRLRPEGRILMWLGAEDPEVPRGLVLDRQVSLAGSERRRVVELVRAS